MNNRHTLTKSLHTVTAVSRIALEIANGTDKAVACGTVVELVRAALEMLGQPSDWNAGDPTMAACIAAVEKGLR